MFVLIVILGSVRKFLGLEWELERILRGDGLGGDFYRVFENRFFFLVWVLVVVFIF